MGYTENLRTAMSMIAKHKNAVFMGQTVLAGGSGMSKTLDHIPKEMRLELPVFESSQAGMAIGMSLAGRFPIVSVYPRINFLMEAMGILTGELDKIKEFSDYKPHVIIRTAIATKRPMDPGPQHLGDYTLSLRHAFRNISVVRLTSSEMVVEHYKRALESPTSTILIEYMDLYDE
jgi:pyruvate/2-oxoglutarate/acetoin dehydrogenase E1 component